MLEKDKKKEEEAKTKEEEAEAKEKEELERTGSMEIIPDHRRLSTMPMVVDQASLPIITHENQKMMDRIKICFITVEDFRGLTNDASAS